MTSEELRRCDGKEGRRALIAVNGKVYDVSASKRWVDGSHEELHAAGQDLTQELWQAPHVRAVVERFPVVDELHDPETPAQKRSPLVPLVVVAVLVAGLVLFLLLR